MKLILDRLHSLPRAFLSFPNIVVLGASLFFVMFALAFFLVYQNMTAMHTLVSDEFNAQQTILSRQAAAQIAALLKDIVVELETLKRLRLEDTEDLLEKQLGAVIARNSSKGLITTGFVGEEGRLVAARGKWGADPSILEQATRSCAVSAREDVVVGPLVVEHTIDRTPVVTTILCTKVTAPEATATFFFAKLDLSGLLTRVTKDIRSGKTGYAWVIDETGMFLYHPEKDFVGENAFSVRKKRKPYISYAEINDIMKNRMLLGQEGTGTYKSGWHRGLEGEVTKLIAFTPVKSRTLRDGDHVWSVAVVAPISEVEEAVNTLYVRNFTVEGTLIAGIFIFGLLLATYQGRMSRALAERVKQTEADLHETERIYRRIVEQATDLIYILDLDMRAVLYNEPAAEMFSQLLTTTDRGISMSRGTESPVGEVYVGRKLEELFGTADMEFFRAQIATMLARQASISYEHTFSVGERKIHLDTKLIPIRDDQHDIRYILGISRDVTDKFELDQKIYNTEKLASIGTLAAGVAHEINNPLGIILGFADLLKERFADGTREKADIETIEQSANYAKTVVENLLGFARITEGLEDSVDVRQSLDTVIKMVKNTLMTAKIELAVDVDQNLPRVSCDPREFQQIVFNLINNSLAAMRKSGGTLTISAHSDGNGVQVSVSDTGVGIPDKIKPRVFDPFFTTKKVSEGTGLGLSLCYGIVSKYGGKISFTSTSREDGTADASGTTFVVSLPMASPVTTAREEGETV